MKILIKILEYSSSTICINHGKSFTNINYLKVLIQAIKTSKKELYENYCRP